MYRISFYSWKLFPNLAAKMIYRAFEVLNKKPQLVIACRFNLVLCVFNLFYAFSLLLQNFDEASFQHTYT